MDKYVVFVYMYYTIFVQLKMANILMYSGRILRAVFVIAHSPSVIVNALAAT